jgi:TatD DNase family protein
MRGALLIDSHAHLNEPVFVKLDEVVARAKNAAVGACVVPAYDRDSLDRTFALAGRYPGFVFPAYGIHPWFAGDPVDVERVKECLDRGNAVAVGEIGLDFAAGHDRQECQIVLFRKQLEIAIEYHLPVIVHCRKAFDPLSGILSDYRGKLRGVMHSFSGSPEWMRRFLDLGFCISFSGSVTRKSARKYHRNAQAVPADRYLLETDAPSIATESTPASEVEPMHLVEIARKMAEIRNMEYGDICRESSENAKNLFHL